MKVFILLFLATNVHSLHLQLFERINYKEFVREVKLSSTEEKTCFPLRDSKGSYNPVMARSIKTDKCVILYSHINCNHKGEVWRLDKDSPRHPDNDSTFLWYVGAFHVCSQELSGGPLLDVDFYPGQNYEGYIMLKYRNLCGCQNIPSEFAYKTHIRSIDNYGNGLAVFEKEHCEPPYVYVRPGRSMLSSLMETTNNNNVEPVRVRSFYPMETVDCARLDATVIKFDFKKDSSQDNFLELENVTTSLESVFINNGPAEITQDYTAAQRVKEVLEFTRARGFSNVHTVGVEVSVENKLKFGLPLVAEENASLKVTGKYQWQGTSSGTDTDKKSVENEETFSIRQSIKIPPCTEYHVNSFVKMVKNYTIEYTATARLTGKAGEDKMQKNELKLHIGPGMEYIRDIDDYAIEVSVKGEMFAKYGVKTLIVGNGHRIPDCLKYTSVSNIQPVRNFVIELPLHAE